jgi:excisionase family DNA binding protein
MNPETNRHTGANGEKQKFLARPLLITATELAALLQVSTRTLWRLHSAGQIPEPVRFGGSTRWRFDEVQNWISEGCPAVGGRDNGTDLSHR